MNSSIGSMDEEIDATKEGKDILNRFLAAQHCFY